MAQPPALSGEASDEDLMDGIQHSHPEALAQLYDRYSGILKALIMRIVHNEAEADDLLQEIYMEIWNHADSFSAHKGKALGWIVTLTRRRGIDRLRKRQAYQRAEERLQHEPEQQPEAWVHNRSDDEIEHSDQRRILFSDSRRAAAAPAPGHRMRVFYGDESARNRRSHEYPLRDGENPARTGPPESLGSPERSKR